MSRGRKLLVAGLAVFALTISVNGERTARAQESQGSSLSERISALRGAFKRTKTPSKPTASPSKKNAPAYGPNSHPRSAASNSARSHTTSHSTLSGLLPKGLFGGKKSDKAEEKAPDDLGYNSPEPPPFEPEAWEKEKKAKSVEAVAEATPEKKSEKKTEAGKKEAVAAKAAAPAATVARVASAAPTSHDSSKARKSPSTSRQENLDATLSDLLQNESVIAGIANHGKEKADQVAADGEEQVEQVAHDGVAPVVIPPIDGQVANSEDKPAETETVAKAEDSGEPEDQAAETEEVAQSEEEPADTEAVASAEEKPAEEIAEAAAAPVETIVIGKEKSAFDISSAIESVAAEALAEDPEKSESHSGKSVVKKKADKRVDVHDTLLSGELYDELAEAEAEPDMSGDQVEEIESPAAHEIAQPAHARPISPRLAALPDLRSEKKVAEVTAMPFETMGEEAEAPAPAIQSAEIDEEPHFTTEQEVATAPNRIRAEAMPITSLRKPAGDVLVTSEQPVIVSHVEGPRSILVGREASYRVILENTSNIAAQNLSAAIQVPEWADLVDVVSTSGEVARHGTDTDASALEWRLPELAARSTQTLRLRLIPRSGREFQLGVQWSQESTSAEAHVEVQEPKLEMSIQGPQEVLFGSPQRFRLTIFNPGTGPAEQVAVCLIPPGKDSASAGTHALGTLGPDEVKEIEMELTAREAGELILQASATAAGGLKAEAIKRVSCHKPELEVDWRGPDEKFSGTETAYFFRVKNPGTAPTDPLEVRVRLPEGVRFLSASDSYAVDSATGVITWRLSGLAPGEEQYMQVKCELTTPGTKEFDVTAKTVNGELRSSKSVRTNVVALADLKLDINDPQGARPVGETVVYEIRVENRGSTDAHGISIVGLFSEGIDPVSVEGAQNAVRDGRVTFQPVKSLPAGGEVLLRIRAVASQVGTHVFRAEVACEDLDTKLAAEETTRFFQDEFHWKEGETPYTAERTSGTISR